MLRLREEQRPATEEELAQLREWRGWGAVPHLFETRQQFAEKYRTEREELRAPAMTTEEHPQVQAAAVEDVGL
ncbi:hypothetical protein GCM10010271_70360 [Streptomyces kurssanovii]|nr:hypothetical protein GCM10010271_70360 [Streptomyces kurssanovii]